MPFKKQWCRTEAINDQVEFDWTITNFKPFLKNNKKGICSSSFYIGDDHTMEWRLKLYPRGDEELRSDYVSLFLQLKSSEKFGITAEAKLTILHLDTVMKSGSFIHTYDRLEACGFSQFVARSELLNSCDAGDTITVRCNVDIPVKPCITLSCDSNGTNEVMLFNAGRGKLSEHLGLLFTEAKNSDVTIIAGNEKFPAHKLILAARSAVFSAMFQQKEMEESIKNEVKLENMEPAVVKGMLEFIYTDKVTDLEALANKLLVAADRYDLERLRTLCEQDLCNTLNKQNATEILVLADRHQAKKLKDYVIKFINSHLFDIVGTEGYKNMAQTYPTLLQDLIQSFVAQKKVLSDK